MVDTSTANVEKRIEAVEHSLLPAISIAGRSQPMLLSDRMAHYRAPGVSVAVIDDGCIEWTKGYGVRDADAADPIGERTLFQACSISKPVAALGALTLVETGILDLDEDVNRKLRAWKVPETPLTRDEPVTLRRLLSHTAGLTVHGVPGHARGDDLPSLATFLSGRHPDSTEPVRVDRVPGSAFVYSGGGYTVMQQLIEDVTQTPFAEFIRAAGLQPLGMTDSTYEHPLPQRLWKSAASGHSTDGRPIEGKWTTFAASAAGGLWTTPADLARYAISVQRAYNGDKNSVLSPSMTREMLRRQRPDAPPGLGPWIDGDRDERTLRFYHSGSNIGYRCEFVAYAAHGQGAVVMTNSDSGDALAREILNAVATVYGWPDYLTEREVVEVAAEELMKYVGEYVVNPQLSVSVRFEDGELMALAPGVVEGRLNAASAQQFFMAEVPIEVTFVFQDDGAVFAMDTQAFGTNFHAMKR